METITKSEVQEALREFEVHVRKEVAAVDAALRSAKHSAPESYISDMKGYSRGLYHMGHSALEFFRKQLCG